MARIRSIKPDFWISETIGALPNSARLTFIGVWCYVDDNGVGIFNEVLITAALYALDDPTEALARTREDLRSLAGAGLIRLYSKESKRYIAVTNWDEHQKPSHPRAPRYPRPDSEGCEPILTSTLEPLRSIS